MDLMFSSCCLLMAFIFALSASMQFNDPVACSVCLINGFGRVGKLYYLARLALWLGAFLFVKVTVEDIVLQLTMAGLWSLDMREKVVREKHGSGLVMASMYLQSKTSVPSSYSRYGMLILVVISYGLSVTFFTFHQREMRF